MNRRSHEIAHKGTGIFVAALVMLQLLVIGMPAFASEDSTEAQGIVDKAKATFNDFMADSNYSWLQERIKDAKGLLIYPLIIKGGFAGNVHLFRQRERALCRS